MSEIQGKGFGKSFKKFVKNQLSGDNLKKNVFGAVLFVASICFPPTASVQIPGVTSQYLWAF